MAQQQINTIIVLRNDETTAWEGTSYRLQKGEVGIGRLSVVKNGETINNVVVKVGAEDANGELLAWNDLPQVEGVIEEELVLTHNFGRHKTANGKVNAGGEGMTVSQWLRDALSEALNPKTNYPTARFEQNGFVTDTGYNEIGSKIKAIKWKTTVGTGSYVGNDGTGTYGTTNSGTSNATGINSNNISWSISNEVDNESTTTTGSATGTFTFTDEKSYVQINSTKSEDRAFFNATATIDASGAHTPYNNLGTKYEAGKITGFDKDGTTTLTFTDIGVPAQGYRDTWYYIGTDDTFELDSDNIRAKATAKHSSTNNFGTVTIPAGTTRVMFAVLGDKSLTSVIDVDGQGLDVKANFTKETVAIEGANGFEAANYSVFHFENSKGIAATKYTVTIS